MRNIVIGKSGVNASVVQLGTFPMAGGELWGQADDREAIKTIHKALDYGITTVDTAPDYNLGHSEEIVGCALQGRRDQYIISTKCGLVWDHVTGEYYRTRNGRKLYRDLSAKDLRRQIEESLRRLKTDYIDIFMTHRQSSVQPVGETMEALCEMKKEGKIRAIGASNVTLDQLKEYTKYGPLDVIQERYSILSRDDIELLLPFCRENNISVQTFLTYERGILTGRFKKGTYKSLEGEPSIRAKGPFMADGPREMILDMLENWEPLCQKYNCSIANLSVAWVLKSYENMAVILGMRKTGHIAENARGGSIILEDCDYATMRAQADKVLSVYSDIGRNAIMK